MLRTHYVYPVVISEEHDDGDYWFVQFPNFPHVCSNADSLPEAIELASELLGSYLFLQERDCLEVPEPLDLSEIPREGNEIVQLCAVSMEPVRRAWRNRSVKKTLSIPAWMNEAGEKAKVNFSQLLQDSLRRELHLNDHSEENQRL